jgi:hypothetical protein
MESSAWKLRQRDFGKKILARKLFHSGGLYQGQSAFGVRRLLPAGRISR